jgi:NADH dehydrogenase [ubiquinone] 1 alpha subcomplex assembly factor 7
MENELAAILRRRIASEGPLSLHDYMQACLYHPKHGYYMSRQPFGAGGDFITAPDVSQIFGELLGLWCAHVWSELDQPANCRLIELGPGRGALMSDALRAASLVPQFLRSVKVEMIETSPALRAAQEERIRGEALEHGREPPPLSWRERLEDAPADGPCFIIANEFLDALPIRQFERRGGEWRERMVTLDEDGAFAYVLDERPPDERLLPDSDLPPPHHEQAREGDIVETCPGAVEMMALLSERAAKHPLAALFIDYGHEGGAFGDSFQAVRNHEYADPLAMQGLCDLTAHVDFGHLAGHARAGGLEVSGPVTQRDFLISLGLRERAAQLLEAAGNMEGAQQIMSGVQRLIEPAQMGRLFKVMGLAGTGQPQLPGFEEGGSEGVK